MTVYDVSHYQSPAQVTAAIAASAQAVFVKATEGTGYVDPEHDDFAAQVRKAGVLLGHYHFADSVAVPGAEAHFFLTAADPRPGELVALDLEAMDGNWSSRIAYAVAWLRAVQNATGARPFWYVNKYWRSSLLAAGTPAQRAALLSYPLWIATAGAPAGAPGVPAWVLHQHSTAGGIDHDVVAPGHDLTDYAIPGGSMALSDADVAAVATAVWNRFEHDGLPLATVLGAVYDATVPAAPVTPGPVPVAEVDYDLLAAKVADVLAARLAA